MLARIGDSEPEESGKLREADVCDPWQWLECNTTRTMQAQTNSVSLCMDVRCSLSSSEG